MKRGAGGLVGGWWVGWLVVYPDLVGHSPYPVGQYRECIIDSLGRGSLNLGGNRAGFPIPPSPQPIIYKSGVLGATLSLREFP